MLYRVLIVDDSKLARMVVAKALKAIYPEWQRVEATSADEALAILTRSAADIVLLDFNMPGRSGLDVLAELRAFHPAMPVALISANSQDAVVARARELEAAYLSKPLDQSALRDFLEEAETVLSAKSPSSAALRP
jgi:CheY-like chemotaxis protein